MNSKYHQIFLSSYNGIIECVALSNTEHIDQRKAIILLKGGNPLMVEKDMDEYLAEVILYVNHFKVLHAEFYNKPRENAISYCLEHNLNFKESRGEEDVDVDEDDENEEY